MAEWIGRVPTCQAVLNECKGTKRKKKKTLTRKNTWPKIPVYFSCKGMSSGQTISCGNPVTSKSYTAQVFCLSTLDRPPCWFAKSGVPFLSYQGFQSQPCWALLPWQTCHPSFLSLLIQLYSGSPNLRTNGISTIHLANNW